MRKMPNFTPVRLPTDPLDLAYRNAVMTFKHWAGPHVQLGTAGLFEVGKEDELLLHEEVVERIIALHLTPCKMYGCTASFTAKTTGLMEPSPTVFAEALRIDMRIEPGEVFKLTDMSVVERGVREPVKWEFELTSHARELSIAGHLVANGVDPGVDYDEMVAHAESEALRMAALARA